MRRTTCSACGHAGLDQFLNLGSTPIADAYTATRDELVNTYPLELAVCNKCWLVQLLEVVDPKILFGTGYSFYTSASPPLSRYMEGYANKVLNQIGGLPFTLEIGCNDGDMLRHFAAAGCQTLGIDPAIGPVGVARERGLDVRTRPFSLAFAQDLLEVYEPFPLVIANHVLAHVADVSDMLAGVSHVLADNGEAIIEVQYLPDLLVNNAFDLVYHEHRNFFSFTSLASAALQHGLYPLKVELTPRQGGSLRVMFEKQKVEAGTIIAGFQSAEQWLQGSGPYEGFQGRVDRICERLWDIVTSDAFMRGTIAGYGAPAKATTLLNYCGFNSNIIDFVTDTTVAKQGRYIPGTGIPIVSPDDPQYQNETFLLLAWNYLSQVLRQETEFTKQGGRWIIPIPAPVLL